MNAADIAWGLALLALGFALLDAGLSWKFRE